MTITETVVALSGAVVVLMVPIGAMLSTVIKARSEARVAAINAEASAAERLKIAESTQRSVNGNHSALTAKLDTANDKIAAFSGRIERAEAEVARLQALMVPGVAAAPLAPKPG